MGRQTPPPSGCPVAENNLQIITSVEMDGKRFMALNNLSYLTLTLLC